MLITLPAGPSSNLDWDPTLKGTYYLDFGWKTLDPFDTAAFNARMLAVEEFTKRFRHAKKVVLAKITGELSTFLKSSEKNELFCAELFSEYLHRLASALPDEAEPMILVETAGNFAAMVLIYCKRRFEHFKLITDLPIEGNQNVIISLPQDQLYDPAVFVPLYNSLENFKCIPEELLNEHWEGVDAIIVDPESLGPSGKRMLYGFEAAGGCIISTKDPLGFASESSLDNWNRSRGIRTPDPLLPKQLR